MTRAPFEGPGEAASATAELAEKIAFLCDPQTHPDSPDAVRAIETHMSWVFLTTHHAYKLKKPLRRAECDLTSVEGRGAHCRMELALNTRLSEGVYLDVVALGRDPDARLRLAGGVRIVDWLIRMRRLPEALMLDRLIASGRLRERQLEPFVARLARFYAGCAPEPLAPEAFRARLGARIARNAEGLRFGSPLASASIDALAAIQQAWLESHTGLLDARVSAGRIVEGHGDLRPEHVCLESPPQVIDCLEFSRELRVLDRAEELGFLALECERLGAPHLKGVLFDAYSRFSGDRPPAGIVHFYQSLHATVRARLALERVAEAASRVPQSWMARAADYLRLAREHIDACPQ